MCVLSRLVWFSAGTRSSFYYGDEDLHLLSPPLYALPRVRPSAFVAGAKRVKRAVQKPALMFRPWRNFEKLNWKESWDKMLLMILQWSLRFLIVMPASGRCVPDLPDHCEVLLGTTLLRRKGRLTKDDSPTFQVIYTARKDPTFSFAPVLYGNAEQGKSLWSFAQTSSRTTRSGLSCGWIHAIMDNRF